jgi:hypothetical protein
VITINHSGDGTTVEGTTREDAATIKQVGGFRWSSAQGFWFLPRSWREPTRLQRARQLVKAFGDDKAELVIGDLAKSLTAEEQAEQHVARARELADHHLTRAQRLEGESAGHHRRSQAYVEGIPMGQPILVGHHSERAHRNALDKSWNALGRAVEASKEAELQLERAKSSAAEAEGYDKPARVGNRVEAAKKELAGWRANLQRSVEKWGDGELPEDSRLWQERARANIVELEQKIARDMKVLEDSGVLAYSKETVAPMDLVKIRGRWSTVDKANPKTVMITSFGSTLPYAYTEIQDHRKPTEDELLALLRSRHVNDLKASLRARRTPAPVLEAIERVLVEKAAEEENQ